MSAFLCSTRHTVILALYILRKDTAAPTIESVRAVARALRKVNNRALFCRYGEKPEYLPRDISQEFEYAAAWLDSHSFADIHAAATCFDYQCSEGDAPKMKEFAFVSEALQYAGDRLRVSGFSFKSAVWSL